MRKYIAIIIAVLCFQVKDAYTSANPLKVDYSGIFDVDIYRQQNLPTNQPYNEAALARLYELKEQTLNRILAQKLEKKLESYTKLQKVAVKQQELHNIFGIFKGILGILTAPFAALSSAFSIDKSLNDLGSAANGLTHVIDSGVSLGHGNIDLKPLIPSLYKEILGLKDEIEVYRDGIRKESIKKEEEEYVIRKRDIHESFHHEIERALIETRLAELPLFNPRVFVQDALKLPLTHTNIFVHKHQTWEEINEDFKTHPFFSKLATQAHQEQLKHLVKEIVFASNAQNPSRIIRLFVGNSGVGKTFTALQIAQFVGLPCEDSPLGTSESLPGRGFFGEFWGNPTRILGSSAKVFLQTGTKNPVLVVNEFDKFLDGPKGPATRFFIDTLLDTSKTEILNEYFNGVIDFSRLIVILTANQDVSEEEYPALKSRLAGKTIYFPDCTPKLAKEILFEKCEKFRVTYHSKFKTEDFQGLIEKTLSDQGSADIRVLETALESEFIKGSSVPQAGAKEILLKKCEEFRAQYNIKIDSQHFFEELVQKVLEQEEVGPKISDLEADLEGEFKKAAATSTVPAQIEVAPLNSFDITSAFITINNKLIAFDPANGEKKWTSPITLNQGQTTAAIHFDKDSNLLFVCRDGYTWAYNPGDGSQKWYNPLKGYKTQSYPTIITSKTKAFFGFNGYLVALGKEDGKYQWHKYIAKEAYVALALQNNLLYAAGNGFAYAFNPDTGAQIAYNSHPKTGEWNNVFSLNEKIICFLYNNYLVVDQRENLKTLFTHHLTSRDACVLCDDKNPEIFYLSTPKSIESLVVSPSSIVSKVGSNWVRDFGGCSLNLIDDADGKRLLIFANNSNVAALFADTGEEAWKFDLKDYLVSDNKGHVSVLSLANSSLLVSVHGQFLALSSAGSLLWKNDAYKSQEKSSSCMASTAGQPSNCLQRLTDTL